MGYQTKRIADILPELNKSWFLPALQREFVWDTEQICELFDSLMRQYPISALLTWKVPEDAREDLEVYEFLKRASHFVVHNERQRAYKSTDLMFVLDGQQRLTSLNIGLRGAFEVRPKYKRTGEEQVLFLNLLRDGETPDEQGQIWYGFEFRSKSGVAYARGVEWFEVRKILNYPEKITTGRVRNEALKALCATRRD